MINSLLPRAAVTRISDQLAFTEFHHACEDQQEAGGYLVALQALQSVQRSSVVDASQE